MDQGNQVAVIYVRCNWARSIIINPELKTNNSKLKTYEQIPSFNSLYYTLHFALCPLPRVFPAAAFAQDIDAVDVVNHPVNTSGLTGLLFTTAPYTLPTGTVEVGASLLTENSVLPDFTITQYPLSVTVGLPHNAELAVRSSFFDIKEGPTNTTTPTERKTGDLDVFYKWNFLPPKEESIRPAFALIAGGSLPTGKNTDMKINAVNHWGIRAGVSGGTEIGWKEHIIGVYADAQVVGQDLTEKRLSDVYELYNAGLLLPISKYQNLQMFAEYSIVQGRKSITLDGGDYSGLTYGLRLVSERFNLTIGTQFLHKKAQGYSNSDRIMAMISMKF